MAQAVPGLSIWSGGIQNSYAASTAVSTIPDLQLPSVLGIAFFLISYIVAIGPLNYFVVKRMKRREMAWVTIPAVIVLFSVISYVAGLRIRGGDPLVNQMSLAVGQVDSETMRVQSLLGVYSPDRRTYNVALPLSSMASKRICVHTSPRVRTHHFCPRTIQRRKNV